MKRFIDKKGEVYTLINESDFDFCVLKTVIRFEVLGGACIEDYMRELCGRIFDRYPNERPAELQRRIKNKAYSLIERGVEDGKHI